MSADIVTFALDFLVVSTPLFSVALILAAFYRLSAQRDRVLKAAFVVAILVTFPRQVPLPSSPQRPGAELLLFTVDVPASRLPEVSGIPLAELAALFLLGGMTISIAVIVARAIVFRWRVARRRPLTDLDWCNSRRDLAAGGIRLTVVDGNVASAFSFGREICIPRWMVEELSPAERESVLAHELNHINRHDRWWAFFIDCACALFFFQPLVFIVRRQFIASMEERADRAAAVRVGSALPLAEVLYKVTCRITGNAAVPSVAFLRDRSAVIRRVERLLDQRQTKALPATAMATLLVLSLVVAVAAPSFGFAQQFEVPFPPKRSVGESPVVRTPAPTMHREKQNAARPLGRNTVDAAASLASVLASDPSPHVRYAAAQALGRRRERGAIGALQRSAAGDPNVNVRNASLSALETIQR